MTRGRVVPGVATIALVLAAAVLVPAPQASAEPVTCDGKVATIVGTAADDVIVGTDGDDVIAGLDGNDEIHGGGGDDVLCGDGGETSFLDGGPGRDMLVTVTGGQLDGGTGDDVIDASSAPPGTTRLTFAGALRGVRVDLGEGTARGLGHDTVLGVADVDGTRFRDRLIGDDLANMLSSGAGDDSLAGAGGNDFLTASTGVDLMTGGRGLDTLIGGDGDDTYRGAGGADAMNEFGLTGNDTMSGGPGEDLLLPGSGDDELFGGGGEDTADGGTDSTSLGDYCDADIERRTNCERP